MLHTQSQNRYHNFHSVSRIRGGFDVPAALAAANPDALFWQKRFEFVRDQVMNLPLPDETIRAAWTKRIQPLTDDNTWMEYFNQAMIVKAELDQQIFSRSVCAHTCKEIVADPHDVEIGMSADGDVLTATETDYFERCMTCGTITCEHVMPLEA